MYYAFDQDGNLTAKLVTRAEVERYVKEHPEQGVKSFRQMTPDETNMALLWEIIQGAKVAAGPPESCRQRDLTEAEVVPELHRALDPDGGSYVVVEVEGVWVPVEHCDRGGLQVCEVCEVLDACRKRGKKCRVTLCSCGNIRVHTGEGV